MEVILMLGSIEGHRTAQFFCDQFKRFEGAPKIVVVGGDFDDELKRVEDVVSVNHPELLDEDGEWTDATSDYVKRQILSWLSHEYLDGAEPASVVTAVILLDDHDAFPLDSVIAADRFYNLPLGD